MNKLKSSALIAVGISSALAIPLLAEDWPTWGRDGTRNMVSNEKDLPVTIEVAEGDDAIDVAKSKGVLWAAKLGSQTYGNPVVAGGKVYVGTNNESPRDEKYQGDYGNLYCLDEKTGKFLWQLVTPKLAAGRNVDWEDCGICSSPAVEADRVYVVTNRAEVLALDTAGLANGNDGDFKDEGAYAAGPGQPPVTPGPTDADIIWRYDMRFELGVFPHFQTASNPLIVGDRLYITTSNGVDWSDKHIPAPYAPALICLDKKTGRLIGQEKAGISARTFYCNWSAPAVGEVGGRQTIVFGGGDGFLYGFDPVPSADGALVELWRIDANPPQYRNKDGKPVKYRDGEGPSEIIATPVIVAGRVYVAIGQDPEHGGGVGAMNCVTVESTGGKLTPKILWQNTEIGRTMSTAAVANGMVLVPELLGIVHCLDAETGKSIWRHDVESNVWGSSLVADGKIYVGNESAELVILEEGKAEKKLATIDMLAPVFSSPITANGVLYVATGSHLFALKK